MKPKQPYEQEYKIAYLTAEHKPWFTTQQWIEPKHALPPDNKQVLVLATYETFGHKTIYRVRTANFNVNSGWDVDDSNSCAVIAWTIIPDYTHLINKEE